MDYQYEQLGPERFQEVCQALLLIEYPHTQCLPVAQPDGGRDALDARDASDTLIFQVKFVRRPQRLDSPGDWITDILEGELPKIRRLIASGATQYILLTNVAGTSHLDRGSIDRAQRLMNERLNVPASVLWRDDLNRRLDNAYDLKLHFPELLTGSDMLRTILEKRPQGSAEALEPRLKSFLTAQYEADKRIRFRQIDLQDDLLTFFVDVPAAAQGSQGRRRGDHRKSLTVLRRVARDMVLEAEPDWFPGDHGPQRIQLGTASLLLSGDAASQIPRVVLEGAPGQG